MERRHRAEAAWPARVADPYKAAARGNIEHGRSASRGLPNAAADRRAPKFAAERPGEDGARSRSRGGSRPSTATWPPSRRANPGGSPPSSPSRASRPAMPKIPLPPTANEHAKKHRLVRRRPYTGRGLDRCALHAAATLTSVAERIIVPRAELRPTTVGGAERYGRPGRGRDHALVGRARIAAARSRTPTCRRCSECRSAPSLSDIQGGGDLAVARAARHQPQDVALALGQQGRAAPPPGRPARPAGGSARGSSVRPRGIEPRRAGGDRADRARSAPPPRPLRTTPAAPASKAPTTPVHPHRTSSARAPRSFPPLGAPAPSPRSRPGPACGCPSTPASGRSASAAPAPPGGDRRTRRTTSTRQAARNPADLRERSPDRQRERPDHPFRALLPSSPSASPTEACS